MEGSGIYYSLKYKYNYTGEFLENKFDGKGKIIYEEHDLYNYYEGDFSEGYMHGSGNLIYKDGSCYKGNFDKNNFKGNGVFIFADGRKYNGTWKKNKMDGTGVFTWKDGTKYKGQYKNNFREGNGVYSFGANLYDGTWVDNLPHGQGMLLNEGLRIEGIFRYGKLVEIIKSKSANKSLFLKFSLIKPEKSLSKKNLSKNSLPKLTTILTPKASDLRYKMTQIKKNLDVNFFIKVNELDQRRKSLFNRDNLFIND